jgi:hypothetical protein
MRKSMINRLDHRSKRWRTQSRRLARGLRVDVSKYQRPNLACLRHIQDDKQFSIYGHPYQLPNRGRINREGRRMLNSRRCDNLGGSTAECNKAVKRKLRLLPFYALLHVQACNASLIEPHRYAEPLRRRATQTRDASGTYRIDLQCHRLCSGRD